MPETTTTSRQLILVDGSSYLFRAFHAMPPLVTSRGRPTGATRGVISMIRKLINDYPESNIAIVFDAKGKTFRNDIYSEYKANRPPMPDELRVQIQPIHDIIRAMGLPLLIEEGVEADDVIGTLCVQASASNLSTLVSTGDKDLAQLVNEQVTIINTMTDETFDSEGVKNKFGVAPNLIVDYLALMGDKVDNIPGVEGVGPKTAVKWLNAYGSMEGVIENANAIGGKIGDRLRNSLDQLRLSHELATIKLDCKLDLTVEELVSGEPDNGQLHSLFTELEFKSFLNELEGQDATVAEKLDTGTWSDTAQHTSEQAATSDLSVSVVPDSLDYQCITDRQALDNLIREIEATERFGICVEFHGEHFLEASIVGISLCPEIGRASYVPIGHQSEQPQLLAAEVLEQLKPVLENGAIVKAGYDLKTQSHILRNVGIDLQPLKSDVLLASYVLNSVAVKHQLEDIARYYLDVDMVNLESLVGKGRNRLSLPQVSINEFAPYSCQRADLMLRLTIKLEHDMHNLGQLAGLYRYYETPLIEVLQTVERNGIRLDVPVLEEQSRQLAEQLESLQETVYILAGEEFNLSSPKQLQNIFYDKLNLPVLKKTPTGQPSTAEPVLLELAEDHELPRLILEHRSLIKLKSTYTDKLPEQVNTVTGRIHSSFQQAVAATGRLSSMDPNLQNIPIRTAEGRRVRQAFVPEQGNKLLAADYSQVELRIMAHLSGDPGLLEAFSSDADVHRATAADVFNCNLDEVSAEQRRGAKAINFGLIYGMSAFGLSKQLKVSRGEAQAYVDRYFQRYPGVRDFMEKTRKSANNKGYVETLFGRRLYLPNINAGNAMLRKAAERTAINAPMQGTAADIIKRAMIDIAHWLEQTEIEAIMILQVHDELVFEVKEADVDLLSEGVRFRMATAAELDVPLVVDVGVGDNWDQAH
ncbi:MAG: DNA polymerase I [Gammaproteobacteria bacterium]|nr:DNA polymerase I [Gammaproteobacteria bacterium]